jgi:ABC-type dipeptide/oligopeptide/nickel transport system ATPase subunit
VQDYRLVLSSPVSNTFRCQKAANSLDIDTAKKSIHEFQVSADLETPYNLGLIVGASGSGKTTLAKHLFGENCFDFELDKEQPIIDQFPDSYSYEECAAQLIGIGLTSVPCWIRPFKTLSNGQQARAIAALQMSRQDTFVVDEWTSVVDRTVAKAMSNCLQKHVRNHNKRVVVLSCHYDVIEWLNPDWIIDCNKQEYVDRRLLRRNFERTEKLTFDIREIDSSSWKYFSKYHYLSERLPAGLRCYFGLFHGEEQIGFQCFANYMPYRKGRKVQMHFNRLVVHPDYVGLGLGIQFADVTSSIMAERGFDVWVKLSSTPLVRGLRRSPDWVLRNVARDTPVGKENMGRGSGFRRHVKTYSFQYVPATRT